MTILGVIAWIVDNGPVKPHLCHRICGFSTRDTWPGPGLAFFA